MMFLCSYTIYQQIPLVALVKFDHIFSSFYTQFYISPVTLNLVMDKVRLLHFSLISLSLC